MAALQHTPFRPLHEGRMVFPDFDVQDIVPYLHWESLYAAWGVTADSEKGHHLHDKAVALIREIDEHRLLKIQAVIGVYAVRSNGDALEVTDTKGHTFRIETHGALTDRIAPTGDYMACYAVTAGIGRKELCAKYEIEEDTSSSKLAAALSKALTGAFTEALLTFVRREMWGYATDEKLSPEEIARGEYRGERLDIGSEALADTSLREDLHRLLAVSLTTEIQLDKEHRPLPEESIYGILLADRQ